MPAYHRPPSINVQGHESDEMQSEALLEQQSQPEPMSESDKNSEIDQDDTGDEGESEGNESRPRALVIPPGPSLHRSSMDPGMLHSDDEPPPVEGVIPLDDDDPSYNTYDLVKIKFERQAFRVNDPFCFARIKNPQGELTIFDQNKFSQFYRKWKYWELEKGFFVQKSGFINKWLDDPEQREVERLVVDPNPSRVQVPDEYNLWRDFVAEVLPPVADEEIPQLIEPIINHMRQVVANGDDYTLNWLVDWMANIVQRPHKPTQTVLVLYSHQGAGKGRIYEWFRKFVLGVHCTSQTANAQEDIVGRFSNGLINKVLVQLDEAGNMHNFKDTIKNIVTSDTLRFEQKGKDTITVNNFCNLVFTTNNDKIISIDTIERRHCLFKCSDVYLGDEAYFVALSRHLDENPMVPRAFYQFLMGRDLSRYTFNFQSSSPITDYYKECQKASIPMLGQFLSAMINIDCPKEIKADQFYILYCKFSASSNSKYVLTRTRFGKEVKENAGVTSKRYNHGFKYHLDGSAIKTHLVNTNQYDESAEIDITECS